ncbi:DivIVA domain-containing protein [Corynebacterium macginleyi]|uniref:DivIVA domain-containing protein n=1 Tax=Corynebacterium macginleyi TaxID=38290 RepID=A0A3M0GAQ8_9CORY|nr:DivIVA domain-containing protein [Corynebacterium macginleyi]MBK4140303.1 DivIVA domain-containing protein [Corynebacterium macginleyi]MBK4156451.1 DivIVA domain-containing protein [Corynebacterium macginleyi]QRJ57148.1 DivIVA domain-containing protein [Corynebacterium macginleyi]QRP20615.1 DivIVA domain-containing protein [Corynebacterium macginleyi]RMB58673.1 DivIVA domain-containing protein [Corynebacterium macginleyi]
MLSWIVLIVVLIAFIVIGTWVWGSIFGPGTVMDPPDEPQRVLENNRVAAAQGRFDDVHFEVVPRGYRQDQVDDLLAHLEQELAAARKSGQKETRLERNEDS